VQAGSHSVRKFVSKSVSYAKGEGEIMDAFELLKADHKKVAELFDLLETASGKRKLDVFKRIKSELEIHTHVEETIFYPALEKPEETHDLTLEAYEEHNVVKTLLAELSGATSATDEWQAKAKVLRENVEHHVKEEENELFDKADDALSDEEIESLGERMAAEKARKQGQPVPKKANTKDKTKKGPAKPGIISKIADFIGLGSSTAKKAAKKTPAKKKTAAAQRPTKASKTSRAAVKTRISTNRTSKQTSGAKSVGGSKKQHGVSSQSAKKRTGRK
jgi:hemerythrin-like domain-containing protein